MKRTEEISGTWLQGHIKTTRRALVEAFGEPVKYEGGKTTIEWGIVFEDGTLATIYDWKRYGLGEPGEDEEMTYNIGGISPRAADKVREIIEEVSA